MHINLRKANESDIPAVISLIKELALYEKAPQEVTITEEDLKKTVSEIILYLK